MKTRYLVHFSNGKFIEKDNFEDAKAVPYSTYIIKSTVISTQGAKYQINKHEVVDKEEKRTIIQIGDVQLIDIGNDAIGWNYYHQELTFHDLKSSETFTKIARGNLDYEFNENVVLFLNKIKDLGSYEAYLNFLKIEELQKEVEQYKTWYESQIKTNESLKLKIKELTEKKEE